MFGKKEKVMILPQGLAASGRQLQLLPVRYSRESTLLQQYKRNQQRP